MKTLKIAILSLFAASLAFSQAQKSVSVTVYNQNFGIVRDSREFDLKSGISEIQVTDVASQIDPTSVNFNFAGSVLEQNYRYDLVDYQKILEKYIDKEITLTNGATTITGTLLSSSPQIVLKKNDGGLTMFPDLKDYRVSTATLPEGLITRPTLVWMINSEKSGKQNVELTYQTQGMNWHAEYVAVLNDKDTKADFNSWVSIENNSGTSYKDAELKLIAGDVNRVNDVITGNYSAEFGQGRAVMAKQQPQFQEKSFFEYHIYNLGRKTTLNNNEIKQISLFETAGIDITKKFVYNSAGYSNTNNKIGVYVEFENKKENKLGIPLPKGKVRIYKQDGKSMEFVGEDQIDHTPKDEKVKLRVGDAFDLVGEDKMTNSDKIGDKVWENSYEVKLKNRKEEDVTIEVIANTGINGKIIKSSLKYEPKDASTTIFKVPVKKGEEVTLTYTVRYNY